ncbi:hypothetical protein PVK06_032323 [Gossypium arboreum]|uniref:Expansin n=1 Tax=Gossypium arboreum TaxID=29729 RepID=A0ABR0NTH9_GOSAR|nr:hypothetical protein PVK06_032323 [Gossypium arboreum]
MASFTSWSFKLLFMTLATFAIISKPSLAVAVPVFQSSPWAAAHATFYGDESASQTMGGACGYGDLFSNGYVTATNICPPNWAQDSNNGGWCNPPRAHFDMSKPAFMKIATWKVALSPSCTEGGGGDIANMWVKGSKTGWISMSHNWGASFQAFAALGDQSLSFKLTSYSTKETIIAWNVAPENWNVGSTYKTDVNFH